MKNQLSVALVGASGYVGGEFLRQIIQPANHAIFSEISLFGNDSAGKSVFEFHPNLRNNCNIEVFAVDAYKNNGSKSDISAKLDPIIRQISISEIMQAKVVIFALPHGKSAEFANQLDAADYNGYILDAGADFRLIREKDWKQFYPETTYAGSWTYGLPELKFANIAGRNSSNFGEKIRQNSSNFGKNAKSVSQHISQRDVLKSAKRIAVPGCNVTAVTLGLQPLVANGLIELNDIVAVLANGYSGAGRTLKPHLLASAAFENSKPYAVGGIHRHIPEIRQNIGMIAGLHPDQFEDVKISFTPTLVPMSRGILATISCKPSEFARTSIENSLNSQKFQQLYSEFYENDPFIRVITGSGLPETANVKESNFAEISVQYDETSQRILVICAIDNMVRGTAGQAIESLKIAIGIT